MIGNLPPLKEPLRYAGLYIFDFGDRVSVGYTVEEIEYLLAEPKYAAVGRVYKIHRAHADGTLEIRGVNSSGWSRVTGIVFLFNDEGEGRRASDDLRRRAALTKPPGLIDLTLCRRRTPPFSYALVMRYLYELDEAVSAWLIELDYDAGQMVEAGVGPVDQILSCSETLEHDELQPDDSARPRRREEVLAAVHFAVQR